MERLNERVKKNILPEVKKRLSKANDFEVPGIEKVVVSVGVGKFKEDKNAIDKIADELSRITGQRPKVNLSKKAVSAFKLRVGQPVGLTVTLRNGRMWDFLEKLVNVALPRVRDFRGLSAKSFDGNGNYTVAIREYSIFPEVKYENISNVFGLEINIKTSSKNDQEVKELLTALGFPFEKRQNG